MLELELKLAGLLIVMAGIVEMSVVAVGVGRVVEAGIVLGAEVEIVVEVEAGVGTVVAVHALGIDHTLEIETVLGTVLDQGIEIGHVLDRDPETVLETVPLLHVVDRDLNPCPA